MSATMESEVMVEYFKSAPRFKISRNDLSFFPKSVLEELN
jgi:hypothetical protein